VKKLFDAYKKLPPEARMFMALLGVGGPVAIFYLLKSHLKMGLGTIFIGLFVVLGIVLLVVLGMAAYSSGREKRRRTKMADELTSEGAQGRVSMSVAAQIKANNQKYTGAIRNMRKNFKIDVYDLPWYITIGDSGCGKTRLVEKGGLTFPTGKPEGYQLGTLNYNWWFTEDAVIIDMAGRLINPQEDADRKEWAGFLKTVSKGRKGFPINGALACISTEHLLQDSPEEIEKQANIMLERLRDLQQHLGVTFATYLLITKCDKLVGFMPFFDRAQRDISFKNQMFGWSRPGEFNQPYDPDHFSSDFDDMYTRLNDLRLRRLAEEGDAVELGMAYGFPEEFRELLDPLKTYIRTLFPMRKKARATKNLIFRGTYFTSATQEGSMIVKNLAQRLGSEAAEQFQPLEHLYPQKRPHFIKDVLLRKVIPEHGLVFRNEQQVVRNQKMTKLLYFGSAAMVVLFGLLFWWASEDFKKTVGEAKVAAQDSLGAPAKEPLEFAATLDQHAQNLRTLPLSGRLLGFVSTSDDPGMAMRKIHAGYFEHEILSPTIVNVENTLEAGVVDGGIDQYIQAMAEYLRWVQCASEQETNFQCITEAGLTQLWNREPLGDFTAQAGAYFGSLRDVRRSNAARFASDGLPVIQRAIGQLEESIKAASSPTNASDSDPIAKWLDIAELCPKIRAELSSIETVAGALRQANSLDDIEKARSILALLLSQVSNHVGEIRKVGAGLQHNLEEIVTMRREEWKQYEKTINDVQDQCCSRAPLVLDLEANLNKWLCDELKKKNLLEPTADCSNSGGQPLQTSLLTEYRDILIQDKRSHVAVHKEIDDQLKRLQGIHDQLAELGNVPNRQARTLTSYAASIKALPESKIVTNESSNVGLASEVDNLEAVLAELSVRADNTQHCIQLSTALSKTGEWGVAELFENWNQKTSKSEFSLPDLTSQTVVVLPQNTGGSKANSAPRSWKSKPSGQSQQGGSLIRRDGSGVYYCMTPTLLQEVAEVCANTAAAINNVSRNAVLQEARIGDLPAQLRDKLREYAVTYDSTWQSLFRDYSVPPIIDKLHDYKNWTSFGRAIANREVGKAIDKYRRAILEYYSATAFWDAYQNGQQWNVVDGGVFPEVYGEINNIVGDLAREDLDFPRNVAPHEAICDPVFDPMLRLHEACKKGCDLSKLDDDVTIVHLTNVDEQADHFAAAESISAKLEAVLAHARGLLDDEFEQYIVDIEKDHLRGKPNMERGGWPYLKKPNDDMATLEYDDFARFVAAIGKHAERYAAIDKELDRSKGRKAYYNECARWGDLEAFDGQMEIVITWVQALDHCPRIKDVMTADFEILRLELPGVKDIVRETVHGRESVTSIELNTRQVAKETYRANWDFKHRQHGQMQAYLLTKHGSDAKHTPVVLGKTSGLAIFPLVQDHNCQQQGTKWFIGHIFDDGRKHGEAYMIELPIDIPDPIQPRSPK
jgi:hypothetical protein